jgi:hypothetical protein
LTELCKTYPPYIIFSFYQNIWMFSNSTLEGAFIICCLLDYGYVLHIVNFAILLNILIELCKTYPPYIYIFFSLKYLNVFQFNLKRCFHHLLLDIHLTIYTFEIHYTKFDADDICAHRIFTWNEKLKISSFNWINQLSFSKIHAWKLVFTFITGVIRLSLRISKNVPHVNGIYSSLRN